jgi:2'-5' RNA ligase
LGVSPVYPPHLTLAIYPDDIAPDHLMAALPGLTDKLGAVPISLVGYGVFPASAIVWAAPVVTIALLDCHARLHAALPGLPCDPEYRPGAWMPHVTLAEGNHPSPADALRLIVPLWTGPIHGRAARLELARFHPVNVLWSGALGSG